MDETQRNQLREFLHVATALLESMDKAVGSGGMEIGRWTSYRSYMENYQVLLSALNKAITLPPIFFAYDMSKVPTSGNLVWPAQKEHFESVHANLSIVKSWLEVKIGLKADEVTNVANFFQVNLRRGVFSEPAREVEIQNAVESLLIGKGYQKGIDYDRETGRVKVSIKEVIPDFIFPRLSLAIEVKLSKDREKSKVIVDEINADIMSYGKKYGFVIFIVYDLGTIRDESEFKHDLELTDGVTVVIVKH